MSTKPVTLDEVALFACDLYRKKLLTFGISSDEAIKHTEVFQAELFGIVSVEIEARTPNV